MTAVLIGISAALALCAAALLVLVVEPVLRTRRSPRPSVAGDADARSGEGTADLSRELTAALERAEEESRRNRMLAEIARTIDLDEVLTRTLEAATTVEGAHAALITLQGTSDQPIVAAVGLSEQEVERQATARPLDGRGTRAVATSNRDRLYRESGEPIYGGLGVPFSSEATEGLGFLTVFTRSPEHEFDEHAIRRLEELAACAGPAIDNARRFREARQLADLDALTGLHNRRYFHETLGRECARAERYGSKLTLIVFDLDDFKVINDQIGHLAGDSVLAELAGRVREAVRSADVASRVGGDEFAVILPESSPADAEQLYRRIQDGISAEPLAHGGTIALSAGVAQQRAGDDAASLFQLADEALYRAKRLGKGRVVAASESRGAVAPQ